jgi:energy-coupling factor transporter ATP-binding protein EcfA2
MDRVLATDRLSVHYLGARSPALLRLSFQLPEGRSMAVLGPSGAGKTTLLQALAGLLYAQEHSSVEGRITLNDVEAYSPALTTAFPTVAMLPQEPRHIISGFVPTVEQELEITLRQARIPPQEWEAYKLSILGQLPISHLLQRSPGTLSGGEIQTVALAIAAIATPTVLLLDEPTTALDQGRMDDLTRFVLRRQPRMSVVLADTTLHGTVLACEHVLVLDRGTAVFWGSREEFWERLPEFQDLVTLGAWLDLWHQRRSIDAGTFRALLEGLC